MNCAEKLLEPTILFNLFGRRLLDIKYCITKQIMGATINQQQQNHRLRTDISLSHGRLICILMVQISVVDSIVGVVETQKNV